MRKIQFSWIIVCLCVTLARAQTNVAPLAASTTSYVSPWETITALNDGYTPANSNDKTHGAYGNWNNPNSLQWVKSDQTQKLIVQ
jgi:hypothetical protein